MTRHTWATVFLVLACTSCNSVPAPQEQVNPHQACGISEKEWNLLPGPAPKELLKPWSRADRASSRFFVSTNGDRWLACIPRDSNSCGSIRYLYTKMQIPVPPFERNKWREEWMLDIDEENFPTIIECLY